MKINGKKNSLFIVGGILLIGAIVLIFNLKNNSVNTDQLKGTINGTFTPAIGDQGTVRQQFAPAGSQVPGLKVHFDKDPNVDRLINCVQYDDDNALSAGARVRCIVAGNPVQVTKE